MTYLLSVLVALDQLANAMLLGSPDETLSSRAYRADRDGKWFGRIFRPAIDALFFLQTQHCYGAYQAEVLRRQYPKNFRRHPMPHDDQHPPSCQPYVDNSADNWPRYERRSQPPIQEVRLRQETLAHLEQQIANAVQSGIQGAMNEKTVAEFWGAGLTMLQKQATERAGQIVIGGLWGLLQRIMLFVMLGGLVYSVGGWSALDKLFRAVFGGGAP